MRAFIAVELGENLKKEIKQVQDNLPEFVGKKTKLENLHLTIKFLGEIDEGQVEIVREKLGEIKLDKFEAEPGELGVFSEKFIRIVWVKLKGCEKLQQAVDKALTGLFPAEDRFMSHITVARVKNVKDKKEFLEKIKKIKFEKKKMLVDKFYLMESVLHEEGPEYKIIEEYTLL